jgi:hypothetical protein
MDRHQLSIQRIASQCISAPLDADAAEVVRWMGALQSQDAKSGLLAVAVRSNQITVSAVEDALREGRIVRTWPMRGTLHLVPAEDAGWMVRTFAPRSIRAATTRRRGLGLTNDVLDRALTILADALAGGQRFIRPELYRRLEEAGVATSGQRGVHILGFAAEQGLIAGVGSIARQPAFGLLAEIAPRPRKMELDEAQSEMSWRYIRSHGPVTAQDFAWWTGSTLNAARAAFASNETKLRRVDVDSITYVEARDHRPSASAATGTWLLPGFDELYLGYRDRSALLDQAHAGRIVPGGNGVFRPVVVHDGRIVGTWTRSGTTAGVSLFEDSRRPRDSDLADAVARVERLLGTVG